jgi:L-threonylcarbamoyladenylate synthase
MTDIDTAAAIIRGGGLVAFPTETVYGLGANALDKAAVERIYTAKGRPPTSPLIVHVGSIDMACTVVREWPAAAEILARRYWPGPLTLVLAKQPTIPDRVTAGLDTVGVRVPAHPIALALIQAAGVPIAAPSANKFTEVSPTTAEHVRQGLGNLADMLLDGGPTDVGIESTVLSLTAGVPVLLRPGMISRREIENLIGPVSAATLTREPHSSPGLHRRHYSPKTPITLSGAPQQGNTASLWWKVEPDCRRSIQMPSDPVAYARRLYEVLHTLDSEGWDLIAIEPVPDGDEWAGVRDRLARAASQ